MGELDISKYKIRTDLAIESIEYDKNNNIKTNENVIDGIKITNIVIEKEYEERLNKKREDT